MLCHIVFWLLYHFRHVIIIIYSMLSLPLLRCFFAFSSFSTCLHIKRTKTRYRRLISDRKMVVGLALGRLVAVVSAILCRTMTVRWNIQTEWSCALPFLADSIVYADHTRHRWYYKFKWMFKREMNFAQNNVFCMSSLHVCAVIYGLFLSVYACEISAYSERCYHNIFNMHLWFFSFELLLLLLIFWI